MITEVVTIQVQVEIQYEKKSERKEAIEYARGITRTCEAGHNNVFARTVSAEYIEEKK